jgi:hypothetical protein
VKFDQRVGSASTCPLTGWIEPANSRCDFVLPDLTGKNFGADAGQGHAKDRLVMRVKGKLRFYGVNAVDQSQSGDLVRFDDATAKGTFLNS